MVAVDSAVAVVVSVAAVVSVVAVVVSVAAKASVAVAAAAAEAVASAAVVAVRGGGGGIFNIPPGRVGKININTVCLEHGKQDPRPRMEYKVVPIEELTTDPKVHQMIQMLANDEITQNVAQAAAWNAANGLSWEEMLTKNRIERMDGYYERYFTPNELMVAHRVVEVAAERADALAKSRPTEFKSSGELIDAEQADRQ